MHFTDNFKLSEFTRSETATRLNINNQPGYLSIMRLQDLVLNVLQPLRTNYSYVVRINSGFRCIALNRRIGSKDTSQHIKGQAADFTIPRVDNLQVALWIRDNLQFDQLILEFYDPDDPHSGWIHCSYVAGRNRNMCLTVTKDGTFNGLGL